MDAFFRVVHESGFPQQNLSFSNTKVRLATTCSDGPSVAFEQHHPFAKINLREIVGYLGFNQQWYKIVVCQCLTINLLGIYQLIRGITARSHLSPTEYYPISNANNEPLVRYYPCLAMIVKQCSIINYIIWSIIIIIIINYIYDYSTISHRSGSTISSNIVIDLKSCRSVTNHDHPLYHHLMSIM